MLLEAIQENEDKKVNSLMLKRLQEAFPEYFDKDGAFLQKQFDEAVRSQNIDLNKEGYELKFLGKSYARYQSGSRTETFVVPHTEHNNEEINKNSENLYIIGDNIDALKHLVGSYAGKIKCIYIDPPYNTGSDGFIYPDNCKFDVKGLSDLIGIDEEEASRILNLQGKSSHSAWLTFMYPRLAIARTLLSDDGVIFISIDDNEQANLKLLCDEIFGESGFAGTFPWRKRTIKSDVPYGVSQDYEWILCYAQPLFRASTPGSIRKYFETDDFPGRPWRIHELTQQKTAEERPNSFFTITNPKNGDQYPANPNNVWRVTQDSIKEYASQNRIVYPGDYDFLKISAPVMRYWKEDDIKKAGDYFGRKIISTNLDTKLMSKDGSDKVNQLFGKKVFSFPKPSDLIKKLLEASTFGTENPIVLDFFSGSASTAEAVMKLNSESESNVHYILIQLPEPIAEKTTAYEAGYKTIDEIGRERIKRAAAKIKEETGADIDYGFKTFSVLPPTEDTIEQLQTFKDGDNMFSHDATSLYSPPLGFWKGCIAGHVETHGWLRSN